MYNSQILAKRMWFPYVATQSVRMLAPCFPAWLWRVPTKARTVFLSFDDGVTDQGTPKLLEILDQFNAKASFFLLGAQAIQAPHLVKAIADAGHFIGNHSHTHPNLWRIPAQVALADFERSQKTLEDLIGVAVKAVRPPHGRVTPSLARWAAENGQKMVMWDIFPEDYVLHHLPSRLQDFVCKQVQSGSIVVLHDQNRLAGQMRALLEPMLAKLQRDHWKLDRLWLADYS